jgi:hypothetical protein
MDRHREERSDAAIQRTKGALRPLDCFASLAMTDCSSDPGEFAPGCPSRPPTGPSSSPFGFSWTEPFRCGSAPSEVLDSLGFPWILSSESRRFNGLRGIFRKEFFSALSLAFLAPGTAASGRGDAEAQNYSWGEPSSISGFRQSQARLRDCQKPRLEAPRSGLEGRSRERLC